MAGLASKMLPTVIKIQKGSPGWTVKFMRRIQFNNIIQYLLYSQVTSCGTGPVSVSSMPFSLKYF
jgi:hypothetical protein